MWRAPFALVGLAFAGALGAASCEGEAPPRGLLWRSGSRLQMQFYDAGDGARSFLQIFDTKTQLPCRWIADTNGVIRCLPVAPSGEIGFSNPVCTKPVAHFSDCLPDSVTYFSPPTNDSISLCAADIRAKRQVVYETFGPKRPDGAPVFFAADGQCVPGTSETSGVSYDVAIVDPSAFVEAHERTIDGGDGVDLVVVDGDDGSESVRAFRDEARATECEPLAERDVVEDGADVCVPRPIAVPSSASRYFADLACKRQLVQVGSDCGKPPAVLFDTYPPQCRTYAIYRVGDALESAWLGHIDDDGACAAEPRASFPGSYWEVGDAFADGDLVRISATTVGDGALAARYLSSPNGIAGAPDPVRVFVSADGTTCQPIHFADGATRCVPNPFRELSSTAEYADAACTVPLLEVVGDPCDLSPSSLAADFVPSPCGGFAASMERVASVDAGSAFERNGEGGCVPHVAIKGDSFVTATPVDASAFPLLEITTN